MWLRALTRLVLVPLGLALGAAVAAFVLVTLGLERLTQAAGKRGGIDWFEWGREAFDLVRHGRGATGIAALLPALLAIVAAEIGRIRSWLYYMLAGGASLAAIPFMAHLGRSGWPTVLDSGVWQVFATAGFAGGLVYWAVAGRKA
jgi:hypothetical protein